MTCLYWLEFAAVSDWESPAFERSHPFVRNRLVLDLCNVPGKTGLITMGVIEKQLERVSISKLDILSGTGDGGGENESCAGVHAHSEAAQPSCVRR